MVQPVLLSTAFFTMNHTLLRPMLTIADAVKRFAKGKGAEKEKDSYLLWLHLYKTCTIRNLRY